MNVEQQRERGFTVVASLETANEAARVKKQLERWGIAAALRHRTSGVELSVDSSDAERARALIGRPAGGMENEAERDRRWDDDGGR